MEALLKPQTQTQTCSTCQHWHGNRLSVGTTRLVAGCSELLDDTLADDYCPDWSGIDGSTFKPQRAEPVPVKQLRHYNCWDAQQWTCEECGVKFTAKPSNKNGRSVPRRFCGDPCYRVWQKRNPINPGCFKPGNIPANKGLKGVHYSPATEFKKGNVPPNTVPIGTVIIREQHGGSARKQAYVKVGEPNQWKARALLVWEEHHGELAKGMILRHKDDDPLNDHIDNLEAITRAQNLALNQDPKKRSEALRKAWRKRKRLQERLRQTSIKDLRRLGYKYYCPVCELPSKDAKLKCHKKAEAKVL